MADKLGLGPEIKELRLGSSFTNPRGSAFHTFRYDFKPASVDTSKMATVDILPNNEVNVTVPHCDGAGTSQTSVFRGPKKPYTKECVLIIDHNTGEITLERLSHNIQLKKTRAEGTGKAGRSSSPVDLTPQQPQYYSQQKKSSPLQKSPTSSFSPPTPSPPYNPTQKNSPKHVSGFPMKKSSSSPHQLVANSSVAPASGSMPLLDDLDLITEGPRQEVAPTVGVLSDSSSDSGSDSSSDSSESDSDSDLEDTHIPNERNNGSPVIPKEPMSISNSSLAHLSMPSHLLSEDLRLSDSGSESD
ncbi:ELL-associated factor 1-like [Daphnia carinata]|uniref:ELL-associated factor 1-like n=1 Tax=Daphnia carinata TaxID=120202 RepID=UPI00257F4C33|nr:ELL-associated factor 1-like [Daphnia carinata]XP_057377399.1 ELL-associated factor 1-like [Daphnia carinata]XP_057377400.1 ELL-associated factor 1-like [Daphnia carinata]